MIEAIKKLSDRPIAFHRVYATISGGITSGLMLSQGMYWSSRTTDPEGWFYKTAEEWEEETALSRREQETARIRLRNTGFWEEKLRGVPAKLHYRIDQNKLFSSLAENAKQVSRETPNKFSEKGETIITETTTETTSVEPEGSFQETLFEGSNPSNDKPKKETRARAKKEVPPEYPDFVRIWTEAYPDLGFSALDGKKIKSLIGQTKAYLLAGGKEDTKEAVVAMFAYVVNYLKKDGGWYNGKDLSIIDSKYRTIIFEIKNGKSKSTPKKQSPRDYINSFKQSGQNSR